MGNKLKEWLDPKHHHPRFGGLEILKYIGPGLLVTVGFIDPGNWAANLAAGADYGYALLWMVTLSTIMLILLQHNVAHLGIVTGKCLAEAATAFYKPGYARLLNVSAMFASVSTSMAEILGGAIALEMLFDIPIKIGAILVVIFVVIMLFTNAYSYIERWIIAFVSIIGLSFLYEVSLVHVDWTAAAVGWVKPSIPKGSLVVVMSVLGAVVMPHNLFLHSEVIQSRQWNLQDDKVIKKQLRYEFLDTFLSMFIGWAINSAMIILAAATFFKLGKPVDELQQAQSLLTPMLGNSAGVIFAVALLMAGLSSTITSGMAAGTIFSGIYGESYDIKDSHSKLGVLLSLLLAFVIILFVSDPFMALIYSQMALSIQLPITRFMQVKLTSSAAVMGKYKNSTFSKWLLYLLGGVVTLLNVGLLLSLFGLDIF